MIGILSHRTVCPGLSGLQRIGIGICRRCQRQRKGHPFFSGNLLQQQRACGRMLIYYFNEDGFIIQSEQDFAIQIPIDILKRCPNIIGVCSANTSVKALCGALKSGFFTHIAARAELIKTLLER